MRPRVLGLLLTLKCNAECAHCCFNSGPSRSLAMNADEACDYVGQAASAGLAGISITGGEPFIDLDRLETVVSKSFELGMFARVVTNGYWAGSNRRAELILDRLYAVGLREISISFDSLHEEFIKASSIKRAIEVALRKGLKVVVSHVKDNGDLGDSLNSYLARLENDFSGNLFAMGGYTVPSGRAIEEKLSTDYDRVNVDHQRLTHACWHVIREPIVVPGGDIFPCCSPSCATDTGFRDSYRIGNLNERHLSSVLDDLQANPLFLGLMLHGPRWVHDKTGSGQESNQYINICDLCQSILCDSAQRARIEKELEPTLARLMIERLLVDAHHGGDIDKHLLEAAGISALRPHK